MLTDCCAGCVDTGTYIVFRIGVLAWMTRWLFQNHARVPLPLYAVGSLGLATMTVMNIILFYRLLQSDFISKKNKNSASDTAATASTAAATIAAAADSPDSGGGLKAE